MLAEKGLPVETEESARQAADEFSGKREPAPAPETGIPLRDYQRRGYEWLYMLDRLHMGGVLADDMGLGKTVQVIALLRATRQPDRTSLIVAPTSLIYNWLSEIRRFAPDMSAAVMTGTGGPAGADVAAPEGARGSGRGDHQLSADAAGYRMDEGNPFRFAVLDEAQNIKNASSLVAAAAGELQADTRWP